MTTVRPAGELDERDRARGAIRGWVADQGARLRQAAPTAVIASLVAAACAPVVWPLVEVHESVQAVVGLLAGTGSGYIGAFIEQGIERLRRRPGSQAELCQMLEHQLRAGLETDAVLRADAASLLYEVGGVEVALQAATGQLREALVEAFWWMLVPIQQEQARHSAQLRHQTDLAREQLIKLNLVVRLLTSAAQPVAWQAGGQPEPDKDAAPAPASGSCPYMGLAAFQAEDARWFFGRQRLVAQLVARLVEAPFLVVVGASGSGKSSVLRAGLLPAVWAGALPGASGWQTVVLTPGAHPLEELVMRVALVGGVAAGSLLTDLRASPERLRLAVGQVLADQPADARLLVVVDQFEELFTLCADQAERRCFIGALTCLDGEQASVVLGVRADFSARCLEYPELVAALQDRQVLVGPMTATELRQVIEGPAAQAGLTLEPGLAERVLADLGEEPGSLPLLSHALWATWQRRRGRVLTLAGYRQAGGVREAISQTAEAVYDALGPAGQAVAKDVFLRLTALGEGSEDTRRRVARAELPDGPDLEVVLNRLAEARLVILGEDSVEVAHEALIRAWPTLRGWLTDDREGLRLHRRLTEAATEWQTLGRDPGVLYRGGRLVTARDWAAGNEDRLNALEGEFLAASSDRERDELSAARRRSRRLVGLSACLVVLLVVAVWQQQVAQQRGNLATARQLAQATATIDQQPLSLLLSLESLRATPTYEALAALVSGLLEPRYNTISLTGHTDTVVGVAFSPDGARLASASYDGTLRVWDVVTGAQIGQPLTGHTGAVLGVAFSPDGTRLASASFDRTMRVWDAVTGAQIGRSLTGHTGAVLGVAFSPDGTRLASASNDQTVRVWDAVTGAPIGRPLTGHTGAVWGVAFSPDGTKLASASGDGTVRVWDVVTGAQIGRPLTGHTGPVWGVAFSPDGTKLASASNDQTLRVWTRPPAPRSANPSPATPTRWGGWRLARTGPGSPPPATTRRCGCGRGHRRPDRPTPHRPHRLGVGGGV